MSNSLQPGLPGATRSWRSMQRTLRVRSPYRRRVRLVRQFVLQVAVGDARGCAVLFEPTGRGASALYGFWLAQLGGVASARGCARTGCRRKPMPDKMEPGNPAMVAVLYLDYALGRLLDVGIERIAEHNRDLSEQISAGLERLGRQVISPSERSQRSGNTCFADDDAHGLCEALADRGVLVWGEYGRVRVSGHLYNNSEDVERFLAILGGVGVGLA